MNRFAQTSFTLLSALTLSMLITGCGDNSSGTAKSDPAPTVQATAITIDNAGTVPVLNNGTTTTVIYVHNNTNTTISGITYDIPQNQVTMIQNSKVQKNTKIQPKSAQSGQKVGASQYINSASAALCAQIAPMQSCPIQFTTPALTANAGQGSMLLTLNYKNNQQPYSFSQIINFQAIDNPPQGVYFASGVNISGFGNSNGYGMVYLYGGGTNQIYTVNSLTSNNPPVTISNGNISGQELASNFVQAVEISSPIAYATIAATLNATSTNNASLNSYTSLASVGVYPVSSGGILISGQVPVIDTAESSNPGGSLLISNAGNTSVTLGTSTGTTGISNLSGCTSGTTLAVGQSCTITFNVTQASGSGNITVNYTGGSSATSVTQAISWYNSLNGALVSMSYSNPMNFPQTTTQTNQVTVANIGGYNLTGVTIPTPQVFGSATVTITYPANNSCQNATLNVGESCSYYLNITDSSVETSKQVLFGVTGSYNNGSAQTYTRYAVLTYSSITLAPNLVITPSPANTMTIEGNGVESASQVLVVSNAGNALANISSQGIASPYTSLFTTSSCGSTIESASTCSVTVVLNPYSATTTVSGTGVYSISYIGGASTTLTTNDNVPFVITPNEQNLTLASPVATGSSSGSGISSSPYVFPGSTTSQIVTFTLSNTGSNPISIEGIQDANSAISWYLNLAQSTCASSTNLAVNESCTIVYNNVLNQNTLAISGLGSSYTENLIVPTIVFSDNVATSTQFQIQPTLPSGGTTVYANATLATIANSVTVLNSGTTNTQVTVQNVLTNASGYIAIPVTTNMEDYFYGVVSGTTTSNCTQSSASSVRTQICTLSSGTGTGSITYQVESAFIESQSVSLHSLYEMSTSNQAVGMSPIYITTTIPQQ
ncbi:MAG: hypothetical protein KBD37_06295 [Burkholderiales bacterium]|nr:hypothetical protein [Burkholderiales bacterium]